MKKPPAKTSPTEFQATIRAKFPMSRIVDILEEGLSATTEKYYKGESAGSEPNFMCRLAYLKAVIELGGLAPTAQPEIPPTPGDDDRLTKALGNLKTQVV
jgi:hypothetical protein